MNIKFGQKQKLKFSGTIVNKITMISRDCYCQVMEKERHAYYLRITPVAKFSQFFGSSRIIRNIRLVKNTGYAFNNLKNEPESRGYLASSLFL